MSARKSRHAATPPRSRSQSSASPLQVGDLAELVYARNPDLSPGAEVEVIGGLETRSNVSRPDGSAGPEYGYEIQIGCSEPYYVLPDQLRPISPGSDFLRVSRWSECPWKPGKAGRRTRGRQTVRS